MITILQAVAKPGLELVKHIQWHRPCNWHHLKLSPYLLTLTPGFSEVHTLPEPQNPNNHQLFILVNHLH